MKIITDEIKQILLPCVATIGCFDGLHRGHRFLIEQVCREARQRNFHSALITFPVHPRQVMQSSYRPQWLTCLPQKHILYNKRKPIIVSCFHLPKSCPYSLHANLCNCSENALMSVYWLSATITDSGITVAKASMIIVSMEKSWTWKSFVHRH